jgi:23S rRNA (cytosine1962-C5)-methyltransferase
LGSAFETLAELVKTGEKFGVVVLDPPKFARSRSAIDEAIKGYRRLNTLGLKLLEPGGFLVSCCCSGLITMDMMEQILALVGADEKRDIQVLQRRGPSPDHPVAATCLESHYLKCIITRVM